MGEEQVGVARIGCVCRQVRDRPDFDIDELINTVWSEDNDDNERDDAQPRAASLTDSSLDMEWTCESHARAWHACVLYDRVCPWDGLIILVHITAAAARAAKPSPLLFTSTSAAGESVLRPLGHSVPLARGAGGGTCETYVANREEEEAKARVRAAEILVEMAAEGDEVETADLDGDYDDRRHDHDHEMGEEQVGVARIDRVPQQVQDGLDMGIERAYFGIRDIFVTGEVAPPRDTGKPGVLYGGHVRPWDGLVVLIRVQIPPVGGPCPGPLANHIEGATLDGQRTNVPSLQRETPWGSLPHLALLCTLSSPLSPPPPHH
ncbi:uncharacterized protein BXZ73DRAFT_82332 [Epithele typhae]|uniref:uncharacterized protein n=1 Tax=Epithele typhae TaxID=378194 RepID=UPI002007E1F3|nr:uncharacterized protein BXZ73DRAFT_82332 [Epithele typhae]KAH9912403.1 hypothetical protein BXZ73DRAFT_82332 [Epithele typhae]